MLRQSDLARFARLAQTLVLALPLFLLPLPARADVTVTGTVTDQQTHQPIVGAIVAAVGGHAKSTTDEAGHFTLASAQAVTRVLVSRIGYARATFAVVDGQPLDAALAPAPLEQQGLEVTGRVLAPRQLDAAQSTGTLTSRDLQRGNGLELENAINTLPGVMMQSRTPWGGAHIQIRGYYPNFSQNSNGFGYQLFLNDIPVTDATGQTILDDVDFASLGKVEVINGPSSSRYGGAIAGTVNYWTAKPAAGERSLSQLGVGGSDGLFRTTTTFASAGDHSSTVLSYGHQTYDSFRPNSGSRKDFARFSGDFAVDEKQSISTYFSYNNSYEQLAGELDAPDYYHRQAIDNPVYALNRSKIAIESERIGFTHAIRFDDRLDARSTLFATTQVMSQPFAHGFNDFNRFSFGARSALGVNAQAGPVKLDGSVGGSFQRTNYTVNGFFIPASRPSDQENYAMNYYGFTEWNATMPHDVILTVGGTVSTTEFGLRNMLTGTSIGSKANLYRRAFDPKFTPRASLLKKFRDALSVYGSVGTGYTAPSLTSFLNSDNTVNTGLKPESATQYEVGTKGLLLSNRVSYSLALFDLEVKDKLVSQRVGAVSSTVNVGKQRNQGSEFALSALLLDRAKGPLTRVRPWMSWTYSDFKYVEFKSDNNNNASTVDFSDKRVARAPKNVMNLGLDLESGMGAYASVTYQHVDAAYVTFDNSTQVSPYRLLGAKLGWQRSLNRRIRLDLAAGGDNLTGSTYYKFLFIGPNYAGLAQAKDGGTGDGYILPGSYDATYYANVRATYSF